MTDLRLLLGQTDIYLIDQVMRRRSWAQAADGLCSKPARLPTAFEPPCSQQ